MIGMQERSSSSAVTPATPDLVSTLDALVAGAVHDLGQDPLLGRVFDGTASRDLYLSFLLQTYHYVNETTPLLRAGARATAGHADPVHRVVHERFAEHAREEAGHEQWVLDDIAALGGDVEAAKRSEPSPAVRAYISMVRAVSASRRPLGLLGVAYFLEGISEKLGSKTAANFRRASKIPGIERALSFVDTHGEADVGPNE
jgi:pyrroloquinoline quinone (PQQ) biosynthesis protein C